MAKTPKPSDTSALQSQAVEARLHAYSPYSQVRVGAAVRAQDGRVFTGCNVENSSYGGTVCAERVAIQTAVAAGVREITEIAIATEASPPWPPCGICRQVMADFASPTEGLAIVLCNPAGETVRYQLPDLLPHAFTPAHLKRNS